MRSVGFKVLKKLCGEVGVVGIKNDPNSSDLGKIYCSLYLFFFGWKVGAWERSSMMVSIHLGGWNKWFVTSKVCWCVVYKHLQKEGPKISYFSLIGRKMLPRPRGCHTDSWEGTPPQPLRELRLVALLGSVFVWKNRADLEDGSLMYGNITRRSDVITKTHMSTINSMKFMAFAVWWNNIFHIF